MSNKLIVALDTPTMSLASVIARDVRDHCGFLKIGPILFMRSGTWFVNHLSAHRPIMLDLKFYDIPETIYATMEGVCHLDQVSMVTVHSAGGKDMIDSARKGLDKFARPGKRPKLLAVTVLTNHWNAEHYTMAEVGNRARLAYEYGVDGLVTPPQTAAYVRSMVPDSLPIICPGVHMLSTALMALDNGASHVVIGRMILNHENPGLMAKQMSEFLDAH